MTNVVFFDTAAGTWRRCGQPRRIVTATTLHDVLPALRQVETLVEKKNHWAAGFINYEAAPAFDPALRVRLPQARFPLCWFGLFDEPEFLHLDFVEMECRLDWKPSISRQSYNAAIQRIRQFIAEGDTYQVNFSFRLTSPFAGNPYDLFLQLAHAQASRNGAYIETDDFAICSASPELFFFLHRENIVTRPMKGTAARGFTCTQDKTRAEALRMSEKNRAENVMIVDMMRNDLGRVAKVGTVQVPSLFDVERYPTVLQMTSTVTARTDASITEIMKALFPCSSVTGAPKPRTMEIIAELESTPRNIYTGAIGIVAPNRHAQFNVAIRTVLIDKQKKTAEYGIGGGVLWDSTADGEYEECLTKARVLTGKRPAFELFETMLFSREGGFFLGNEHRQRLRESAEYFGFPLDDELLQSILVRLESELTHLPHDSRVRLTLHRKHEPTVAVQPVDDDTPAAVRVRLAAIHVDSKNPFLYHKTTYRAMYDAALHSVSDCDDAILWNERGEITESTIANIVIEVGGDLCTPPVECGLLAGVFRERLLAESKIKERIITKEEFLNARRAFLINSVRKWREMTIVH